MLWSSYYNTEKNAMKSTRLSETCMIYKGYLNTYEIT